MTSDTENENPWIRYNALAEKIDEALVEDGPNQPMDVLMACLIVIGHALRAAPSEAIFAHEVGTLRANFVTLIQAIVQSRGPRTPRIGCNKRHQSARPRHRWDSATVITAGLELAAGLSARSAGPGPGPRVSDGTGQSALEASALSRKPGLHGDRGCARNHVTRCVTRHRFLEFRIR
jgi:hypothetical protein